MLFYVRIFVTSLNETMTKNETYRSALLERAKAIDAYIKSHIPHYPAAFFQNLDPRFGYGHNWRMIRSKMAGRRAITERDIWWVESGERIVQAHRKHIATA